MKKRFAYFLTILTALFSIGVGVFNNVQPNVMTMATSDIMFRFENDFYTNNGDVSYFNLHSPKNYYVDTNDYLCINSWNNYFTLNRNYTKFDYHTSFEYTFCGHNRDYVRSHTDLYSYEEPTIIDISWWSDYEYFAFSYEFIILTDSSGGSVELYFRTLIFDNEEDFENFENYDTLTNSLFYFEFSLNDFDIEENYTYRDDGNWYLYYGDSNHEIVCKNLFELYMKMDTMRYYEYGFYQGSNEKQLVIDDILANPNDYDLYTENQYIIYGQNQYESGYHTGIGEDGLSFNGFIKTLFHAPVDMFKGAFNFSLPLGNGESLDLQPLLTFLLTIGVVLAVVKLVMGKHK